MGGRLKFSILVVLVVLIIGIIAGVTRHNIALAKKPKTANAEVKQDIVPSHSEEASTITLEKRPTVVDSSVIHYRDKVIVLTYHHFDEKESTYTMTPQRFHEHLQILKNDHYNVISMDDFIGFLNGQFEVPPNAVLITIDDGYHSVYKYAFPELLKQGFTATTFLIVGSIGNTTYTPPFMTWDEVKEMAKNGFSFYSHTYDLHDLKANENGQMVSTLANRIFLPDQKRLETEDEYVTKVKTDLAKAEQVLKDQLGNTKSMLCFPHGNYNREVIDLAQQVGIDYFFTGKEGINTRRNREIFRIDSAAPWMTPANFEKKINRLH
ncbi:MAG TPA: polysaccharide deacetylase family protein [Bacillota bacterium]|nr:polysaccharide deacetylase family protein [Bacillota bacterium]